MEIIKAEPALKKNPTLVKKMITMKRQATVQKRGLDFWMRGNSNNKSTTLPPTAESSKPIPVNIPQRAKPIIEDTPDENFSDGDVSESEDKKTAR